MMARNKSKPADAPEPQADRPMTCGEFSKQCEYQIGQLVTLKSGGPDMTVIEADCFEAECWWFDGRQKLRKEVFPLATLGSPNPVPF